MVDPVEKKLLMLGRGFRARRHRFAVLAVVGWVLVAQTLLVVHGAEHSNAESSVSCLLCSAAHHHAAAPAVPQQAAVPAPMERLPVTVAVSRVSAVVSPYRSRGPPTH